MTVLTILLGGGAFLLLAGRWYARVLAGVFGEEPVRPTPAVELADGKDYVATRMPVVFAHHFASIAGAGPIVGPIIGVMFGWLPALLWIVLGAVFAGGAHDFGTLFVSMREKGQTVATIARRTLGVPVFLMFVFLLIVLMTLVNATFLNLSAKALTSTLPTTALGSVEGIPLAVEDGQVLIGGVASTSVIVLTCLAPLMGWLYLKRKAPVWLCSVLAVAACGVSIAVGLIVPVRLEPDAWIACLSVYCLLAAGLPVWIFLQSRDFLNVHILYVGMAVLMLGLLAAGVRGALAGEASAFPAFVGTSVDRPVGAMSAATLIWPFLFINIACGACSGFHSLCASGTTSKQIDTECAARRVGYHAMLLEGFLATCVVAACVAGLSYAGGATSYTGMALTPAVADDPAFDGPNYVLVFAVAIGNTLFAGLNIPVWAGALFAMLLLEGFLVTTLDTAVRLSRYLFQEAWLTIFGEPAAAEGAGMRLLRSDGFNTALVIALTLLLALSGQAATLWPLFGSGNQLLAALSLLVVSAWLLDHGRKAWVTLLPCGFLMVTAVTMLGLLLAGYVRQLSAGPDPADLIGIWARLTMAATILLLTAGMLAVAARRLWELGTAGKAVRPA